MAKIKQKIVSRVIIEMAGSPKEFVEQTMKEYLKKIKENKDIKIVNEYSEEPVQKDKLWGVFTELEMEMDNPETLVGFCFDFMPTSIEILEPEEIKFTTPEFTNFMNDLQGKLHNLDLLLKNIYAENKMMKTNGVTLMKNIVKILLKDGPKDINHIAAFSGMPQEAAKKFLDSLEKEGKIAQKDGKYVLCPPKR